MVHFCHVAVGYVALLSCLDRADSPPVGLPDNHKQAKRNQPLAFLCEHFSIQQTQSIKYQTMLFVRLYLFTVVLDQMCVKKTGLKCKNMIVLSDKSELLPHPVDGLADFSGRVVLKHHHHVVF